MNNNLRVKGQRKTKDPCLDCGLHKKLCVCSLRPNLTLKTRVLLVVHAKELKRTTNTGRLAIQALTNSRMFVRGESRQALDLSSELKANYRSILFFPHPEARELDANFLAESSLPIQLIVPDGNWRQASKVGIRQPELRALEKVMISTPNVEPFHLRAESSPMGMATLQAINEALRRIEGDEVFAPMDRYYRAKLEATLRGRGQL